MARGALASVLRADYAQTPFVFHRVDIFAEARLTEIIRYGKIKF
jgi:hypothetical protein